MSYYGTVIDPNIVAKLNFRSNLEDQITALLIRHELSMNWCEKLYICLGSELGLPHDIGCLGATSPLYSSILRPQIGGRWKGNGPCILISDHLFSGPFDVIAQNQLTSIAIHEVAHVAYREDFCSDLKSPDERNNYAITFAADQTTHHSPSWLRTMMHLSERAIARGILQVPIGMHNWGEYSTETSYQQCLDALRDEIRAQWNYPVSVLKTVDAPQKFKEICRPRQS